MLTLSDGRSELWQWDTGRTLSVPDDCSQVHFSNKVFGRSIDVDVVDVKASIPDILLQTDKELTAWAFVGTVENGYTKISKVFKVNKRNKPADYVFTPPDQTTLGEILDRIEDLENRPSGDVSEEDIQNAVNDYLDKNPISIEEKDPTVPDWAKRESKPAYTAQEVGALPNSVATLPNPHALTIGGVSYDGSEAVSVEIPSGGGGAGWKLIGETTTTEAVSLIEIKSETPLDEMLVYFYVPPIDENPGGTSYLKPVLKNQGAIPARIGVTVPNTKFRQEWWYFVQDFVLRQYKDGTSSAGTTVSGVTDEVFSKIRTDRDNGGGVVGFQLYWNNNCTFPAGVILKVWGR